MDNQQDMTIGREQFDIPLSEIDLGECPTVTGDAPLKEAVEAMQKSRVGALCYVKDGYAAGMISERDLIHKYDLEDDQWLDNPCKQFMTPGPFTIKTTDKVSDAIKLMAKRGFRNIPVVDEDDKYVGLLTIRDLVKFLVNFFPEHVAKYGEITEWNYQTVDDYSEGFSTASENLALVSGNIFMTHLKRVSHHRPLILDHESSLVEVIELMRERKRGAIILTRFETELVGIITERDLLFRVFGKENLNEKLKANQFMTPNPHTLLSKHYLAHAINNMFCFKYRSTIVVNEDRYPLSIVSLLDIFKYVAFAFYGDELSLL
jgi:CBS domain-containing protein